MTVRSLQPQPEPFPEGLRQELPNPFLLWDISSRVFQALEPCQNLYKRAVVLPTDPEGLFILRHFAHDRPTKWSIRKVYCIHSPLLTRAFETTLQQMDQEATKFPSTWQKEPQAEQRAVAIERWKKAAAAFSPFQLKEPGGRQVQLEQSRVLPLWHGTSEDRCQSVAHTGFTYFGKVALTGTASGSTDEGYFGSGIYFTNSARYSADIYSSGHLLLSWVSMREPFPVVHNGQSPLCKDMVTLKGKGAYKNYNAHYVPVVVNPPNPNNAYYYPCKKTEAPFCDEVVVFQSSQALPRFWIELEANSPTLLTPSNSVRHVEDLSRLLFRILARPEVLKDIKLRKILCEQLSFLLKSRPGDDLEETSLSLAQKLSLLISKSGKIDPGVRSALVGVPLTADSHRAVVWGKRASQFIHRAFLAPFRIAFSNLRKLPLKVYCITFVIPLGWIWVSILKAPGSGGVHFINRRIGDSFNKGVSTLRGIGSSGVHFVSRGLGPSFNKGVSTLRGIGSSVVDFVSRRLGSSFNKGVSTLRGIGSSGVHFVSRGLGAVFNNLKKTGSRTIQVTTFSFFR